MFVDAKRASSPEGAEEVCCGTGDFDSPSIAFRPSLPSVASGTGLRAGFCGLALLKMESSKERPLDVVAVDGCGADCGAG
jgi:hypothetical protein